MSSPFARAVTLPGPDELMQRLRRVSSEPMHVESIYPEIVTLAGRSVIARDLVVTFVGNTRKLSSGFPSPADDLILTWIDALVDDAEVRRAARAILTALPAD